MRNPAGWRSLLQPWHGVNKSISLQRKMVALTEDLWKTVHLLVAVMCQSINKCPVCLPPGALFTAVSAHTVSEIYPWSNRSAVLSPWKCAARDKFQDVRGAVSVKEYTGHYHLQIKLACKLPLPSEPDPCWGWAELSHSEILTCMQLLDQTMTVSNTWEHFFM